MYKSTLYVYVGARGRIRGHVQRHNSHQESCTLTQGVVSTCASYGFHVCVFTDGVRGNRRARSDVLVSTEQDAMQEWGKEWLCVCCDVLAPAGKYMFTRRTVKYTRAVYMGIMGSVREQQARCTCARGAVSAGAGDGVSVHVEKCTSVQGAVSMHRQRDLRMLQKSFSFAWMAYVRERNYMRWHKTFSICAQGGKCGVAGSCITGKKIFTPGGRCKSSQGAVCGGEGDDVISASGGLHPRWIYIYMYIREGGKNALTSVHGRSRGCN